MPQQKEWMAAVLCGAAAAWCSPTLAESGTWSLLEDNDGIFSHQDRHYTQGARIDYVSPPMVSGGFWDRSFDFIGRALPMYRYDASSRREIEWQVLGQSIFTPTELHQIPPDPHDRPYAGWLYTGLNWLQENADSWGGRSLHDLEFSGGVTGPAALAKQAQNGFHAVFGYRKADGFDYQLKNRAAVQFSYTYRRRVALYSFGRYGFDAVPQAGLSLGTVLRDASVGALLRFGDTLGADYGPDHIQPALSGSGWFDRSALGAGWLHGYVYAGAQQRAMLYNRLIDSANEIQPSGLDRETWVHDWVAGVRAFFPWNIRVDVTTTLRSHEYRGQDGDDRFGSATLSFSF